MLHSQRLQQIGSAEQRTHQRQHGGITRSALLIIVLIVARKSAISVQSIVGIVADIIVRIAIRATIIATIITGILYGRNSPYGLDQHGPVNQHRIGDQLRWNKEKIQWLKSYP